MTARDGWIARHTSSDDGTIDSIESSDSGTVDGGTTAGNGGSGGSSRAVLPSWLPSSLSGFRNLVLGIVATWIVGMFFAGIDFMAGLILMGWNALIGPIGIVFDRLLLVTGLPFEIVQSFINAYADMAMTASADAGLLAPLVALVFVMVPILVFVAIAEFAIGVADTYLPLSAIPGIGWVFDR